MMNRLSLLLLLLGACASLAAAATAPTFCKCTCFTNSTIIEIKSTTAGAPLTGSHLVDSPSSEDDALLDDLDPIIPSLDDDDDAAKLGGPESPLDTRSRRLKPRGPKRAGSTSPSCSQCNRAFCLAQSLPICKGAADSDVVTMCFQRDSRKDMIIVWGFILGTAGLLGWAGVKKIMEMRESAGGIAGAVLGGREGGAVPVGRVNGAGGRPDAGLASGSDGGMRGQYASVGGHNRENSVL